jgi:hypothetical protein
VFDGVSLAPVIRGEARPSGDAPALAEAYTSDTREFVDYQRRQLRGEHSEPLRHVLVGQAAYLGSLRLARQVRRYSRSFASVDRVDVTRIERIGDDLIPRPDPEADATPLTRMLDDYRAALAADGEVLADESIRLQLRALGYAI